MSARDALEIAEVPYESGELHFRYSRYLRDDRTKWIKHGLFRAYHKNGQLASEGEYQDGAEVGMWRDFHENGQLAAEGKIVMVEKMGAGVFGTVVGISNGRRSTSMVSRQTPINRALH